MAIKQAVETFTQTEAGNVILETSQSYISGSVKIYAVVNGQEIQNINVTEIGGTYLQLETALTIGAVINIYYDVRTSDSLDVDILQRLRALEEQVLKQGRMIDILTSAVENRVDKHTFKVWLKAMEQSYGKPILEQNLLGIQSVHQSSND